MNLTRKSAVVFDPSSGSLDAAADALSDSGISVVGRAREPREAIALVERHQPGLLVADASGDGLAVIREACSRVTALKAIAVGSLWDDGLVSQAFTAGAAAFVVRTEHFDTFGVAAREPAADPLVVRGRETAAA